MHARNTARITRMHVLHRITGICTYYSACTRVLRTGAGTHLVHGRVMRRLRAARRRATARCGSLQLSRHHFRKGWLKGGPAGETRWGRSLFGNGQRRCACECACALREYQGRWCWRRSRARSVSRPRSLEHAPRLRARRRLAAGAGASWGLAGNSVKGRAAQCVFKASSPAG